MLPRLLPAFAVIALIAAACGQKPDSTSSADTLAIDSLAPAPAPETRAVSFTDNELFNTLLPFDLANPDDLRKWFPGIDGDCEGFDNEDGTPWYRLCAYNNGSLAVTYYDFFDNEPQRFYFYEITSASPDAVFGKGIHVGMSKREFIDAVKLTDPDAPRTNLIRAFQEPGDHSILYEFADDRLEKLTINFNYDSIPNTVGDFVSKWTEIYINEAEGQEESHIPCEYRYYILEQAATEDETTKYLLSVGGPQDVRVDSVQSIKRTAGGFVITARYMSDPSTYTKRVTFNDYSWTLAEWDGTLCASEGYGESLYQDECPDGEP